MIEYFQLGESYLKYETKGNQMKISKVMGIGISVIFILMATGIMAEDKKTQEEIFKYAPFEDKKVKALADCILLLQPRQTPFVASFIALNVIKESKANNIDPDLVMALIYVESQFNPNATSSADAVGLMQVRYATWKAEPILTSNGVDARSKLYWIDNNIKCGVLILSSFLKESNGNIASALFRYNTGGKLTTESWRVEYNNKVLYYFYKIREHQLDGHSLEPDLKYTSTSTTPAPIKKENPTTPIKKEVK